MGTFGCAETVSVSAAEVLLHGTVLWFRDCNPLHMCNAYPWCFIWEIACKHSDVIRKEFKLKYLKLMELSGKYVAASAYLIS